MPLSDLTEILSDLEPRRDTVGVTTTRVLRADLRDLEALIRRRDDGSTVPILLATIIHEGTRKLVESEA